MNHFYYEGQYYIETRDNDDDIIITDRLQHIRYWIIGRDEKVLYRLINLNVEPVDVVIPHKFSTGHQIDVLGHSVVSGSFKKITISNGIRVGELAFVKSNVDEVVWPDDCLTIPPACFFKSSIRKISNICNVKKIGHAAFEESHIRELQWPEHCEKIPEGCFSGCGFEEIDIQNVKEIQKDAFSYSGIKRMIWPSLCTYIPIGCFYGSKLEEIDNLVNVERIDREAFYNTKLISLDLSNSNISHLEEYSLSGLPNECNIALPYYVSQEEFYRSKMMNPLR